MKKLNVGRDVSLYVPSDIREEHARRKAVVAKSRAPILRSAWLIEALIFDPRMERIWTRLNCTGDWLFTKAQGAIYAFESVSKGDKNWTASLWKRRNEKVASEAIAFAIMLEKEFGTGFDPWPWTLKELAELASARAQQEPPIKVGQPRRARANLTAFTRQFRDSFLLGKSVDGSPLKLTNVDLAVIANVVLRRSPHEELLPEEVREMLRDRPERELVKKKRKQIPAK